MRDAVDPHEGDVPLKRRCHYDHLTMQETLTDVYTVPREHLDLCAMIRQIAREKVAPRSAEIDEQAEYPWDIRKVLADQDILGLPFPTEYGGTGTGTLMLQVIDTPAHEFIGLWLKVGDER